VSVRLTLQHRWVWDWSWWFGWVWDQSGWFGWAWFGWGWRAVLRRSIMGEASNLVYWLGNCGQSFDFLTQSWKGSDWSLKNLWNWSSSSGPTRGSNSPPTVIQKSKTRFKTRANQQTRFGKFTSASTWMKHAARGTWMEVDWLQFLLMNIWCGHGQKNSGKKKLWSLPKW
jgi:hypothetical protein